MKPIDKPITQLHGLTVSTEEIWFGTNGGLLRYDKGTDTWRHYTVTDGLPNNEVWGIAVDGEHIWTAHIGGVVSRYSLKMDEWRTYEVTPSVEWSSIGVIAVDPEYVWVTTVWEGIKRYDKSADTWTSITELDGLGNNETNDLLIDGDYVWVTGWGDASRYDRRTGRWEIFSRNRVLSDVSFTLNRGMDGIWLAYPWSDWGNAIASKYHHETNSWTTLKTPRVKEDYFGRTMQVVETADSVWFVVEGGGIARYNKASKDWTFFNAENGLASNTIIEHSLVVDDDNVWVGTAGGLCAYNLKNEVWTTYTQAPLAHASRARKVYAIAAETRYVWVGTPDGLHRYDKQTDRWFTPQPTDKEGKPRRRPSVTCLTIDEKYAWLGTDKGALRYDKAADRWDEYTDENGLPANTIRDLGVNGYDLWIATDGGAAVFNRLSDDANAWEAHTQTLEVKAMQDDKKYAQTLLSNDVRCVSVGEKSVWFGTDKGACRYDREKKTWETLTTQEELGSTDISTIAINGDDVWFGTSQGVTKYNVKSGDFVTYTQTEGLASDIVTCIAINPTEIWFGSAHAGVTRLNTATGKWRVFNTSDGLLHNRVEAIAFDGDGIWFGTELGLCRYNQNTGTWTSFAEAFND